ncbi:MAG: dethiobiotin synthase [Candidatus Omnitrophica bacterium]|nr:dethiobiotin synthase [Candidatus Omnitrophota bacterium]
MRGIFVTGTDTGVGKSVVTGLLAGYLEDKGYSAITQKWIQTGSKRFPSDIDVHLKLMGRRRKDIKDDLPYMSSYNLGFPSSPHLAAKLEKRRIRPEVIKKSWRVLSKRFDYTIAEGVGGALVPYNGKRLVIDIAGELGLPVLIVCANKLGAINHAVLTVEAIRKRNMRIIGLVFNHISRTGNDIILKDNPDAIKKVTGEDILGSIPYSGRRNSLYKAFRPIGKRIAEKL